MSILYKDKECTVPALCPLCFCQQEKPGADYHCKEECAWNMRWNHENYICLLMEKPWANLCVMHKKEEADE